MPATISAAGSGEGGRGAEPGSGWAAAMVAAAIQRAAVRASMGPVASIPILRGLKAQSWGKRA